MTEQKEYLLEIDFARLIAKRTGRTIRSCREFTRDFLETLADVVADEQRLKLYGYFTVDYVEVPERELCDPYGRPCKVESHKLPRMKISECLYKKN